MAFSVYPEVNKRLERGPPLQRFIGELAAVHCSRHDHVGKQQVDRGGVVDNIKCFGGVARLQRGIAKTSDLGNNIFAHQRVVLDDKHDLLPALRWSAGWGLLGDNVIEPGGARQIKLDGCPVAFLAVNLDMPA